MVAKIEINLDHRGNTGDGLNPLKTTTIFSK